MSRAGISSRILIRQPDRHGRSRGYTLIELALVVLVLGIVSMLILPRLTIGSDVKATSRRLSGMIHFLAQESLARRRMVRLTLDLDEGKASAEGMTDDGSWLSLDPLLVERTILPGDQRLRDVATLRQGKVTSGRAYILFFPGGGVDRAVIHLVSKEAVYTLAINPLTGTVSVRDADVVETDFDQPRPKEFG